MRKSRADDLEQAQRWAIEVLCNGFVNESKVHNVGEREIGFDNVVR